MTFQRGQRSNRPPPPEVSDPLERPEASGVLYLHASRLRRDNILAVVILIGSVILSVGSVILSVGNVILRVESVILSAAKNPRISRIAVILICAADQNLRICALRAVTSSRT